MQILIKIGLNTDELWPKQVLPKVTKRNERGRGTPLTPIKNTNNVFKKVDIQRDSPPPPRKKYTFLVRGDCVALFVNI